MARFFLLINLLGLVQYAVAAGDYTPVYEMKDERSIYRINKALKNLKESVEAKGNGDGDAVLSGTQTWTGGNTDQGWRVQNGSVTLNSSFALTPSQIFTSTFTISTHTVCLASGTVPIGANLPPASGLTGQVLSVLLLSTNSVTFIPNGSDRINNSTNTISVTAKNDTIELISDGSGWQFKSFVRAYIELSNSAAFSDVADTRNTVSWNSSRSTNTFATNITLQSGGNFNFSIPGRYLVTIHYRANADVWQTWELYNVSDSIAVGQSAYIGGSVLNSVTFIANIIDTSKTYQINFIPNDTCGIIQVAPSPVFGNGDNIKATISRL